MSLFCFRYQNTANIEQMLLKLAQDYTIVIVTHNLAQAKRISDYTAFLLNGELVEYGETKKGIFPAPPRPKNLGIYRRNLWLDS